MSGTGQTPPPKSPDGYVAFDTKDRVARLKIFKKNYPTHTPGYHYLLDVVYSGQNVTQIVLVFTFLMVFIKGKNLQPIGVTLPAAVLAARLQLVDDGLPCAFHKGGVTGRQVSAGEVQV